MNKAALRKVAAATLAVWTDDEIRADPAGAMKAAQDAMRAALAGYAARQQKP